MFGGNVLNIIKSITIQKTSRGKIAAKPPLAPFPISCRPADDLFNVKFFLTLLKCAKGNSERQFSHIVSRTYIWHHF